MTRVSNVSIERLCREVSESLWSIYHGHPDSSHLMWPAKRDDSARVSEQESKVVITHWLERNGLYFSVETPTREVYRQSGVRELSARIDLTVYGSRDPADRVLNLELKAGTPGPESFRKDFEKLVREGVPGAWFHTLPSANARTWNTLADRVQVALGHVLELHEATSPSLHFAFCVLDQPILIEFDLDYSGDWRVECGERFARASAEGLRPEWTPPLA